MQKLNFKNIPDEQLATFVDGAGSEQETCEILEAVQSKEDFATLALTISAQAQIVEEEDMPDVATLGKVIEMRPFERLPMAGFLGNITELNDETKE